MADAASLCYTGMPLARHANLREDEAWLNTQRDAPDALLLVLANRRNLTARRDNPALLSLARHREMFDAAECAVYLGHLKNQAVFCIALDADDDARTRQLAAQIGAREADDLAPAFTDLRDIASALPAADAALFAYARGMTYWHSQNRFCSRCGAPSIVRHGGHMRICASPECARQSWPRINPAVIMLVRQIAPDGAEKCLLGRHANLAAGVYSTLAGYVECGESLEEAVAREVFEESGVRIDNATYIASQPWPFPSAMMLGFHAETTQEKIAPQDDELEDVRWFSRDEVLAFGESGGGAPALPRKDSIARHLIELWLRREAAAA